VLKRWILFVLVLALVAVGCGDDQSLMGPGGAADQTTLPGGAADQTTLPGGTGGLGTDEQALADAIGGTAATEMGAEFPIDADQFGSCMGTAVVGALGAQRLADLGVTASDVSNLDAAFEQLTPAEQQAVFTAMIPCLDTPEVRNLLVQEISASGLSQQASECIVDGFLDPAVLGDIVGLALSGEETDIAENEEFVTMMMTIMMGCLTPEEMTDLMGGG